MTTSGDEADTLHDTAPVSTREPTGHGDDHVNEGHDGHGGHDAHAGEALGPIDLTAWGAGALGIALGLVVAFCTALATAS